MRDRKRNTHNNKHIIHLCRIVKTNIKKELTEYKYHDMLHHVIILNGLQTLIVRR